MNNWQASLPWFEDEAQRIRSMRCKGSRQKLERRELKELTDFLGQCPVDMMIHDSNEIFLEQMRGRV